MITLNLKVGCRRYVIVIGPWIALKFPRIRLWLAVNVLRDDIKNGNMLNKFQKYDYRYAGTIQHAVLAGLMENWKEFVYWRRFGFDWLVPTYFSLFGLVNVQKAGEEFDFDKNGIFWSQISEHFGDKVYEGDEHAFAEDENYVLIDSQVRLVDYGNFRNEDFFAKYEERLREFEFSLPERR